MEESTNGTNIDKDHLNSLNKSDQENSINKSKEIDEIITDQLIENDGNDNSILQNQGFNTQIIDLSADSVPETNDSNELVQNKIITDQLIEDDGNDDSLAHSQGFNTQIIDLNSSESESSKPDLSLAINKTIQSTESKEIPKNVTIYKTDDENLSNLNHLNLSKLSEYASTSHCQQS